MKKINNKIAILIGSFHKKESEVMISEARKTAIEAGLEIIEEVWVPGSYEKPLALKRLLISKNISGVVVLGIIEKGETKHGLVMAEVVMKEILELSLSFMKPVGIGILGPEILAKQISTRLKPYARKAVLAVKEMI